MRSRNRYSIPVRDLSPAGGHSASDESSPSREAIVDLVRDCLSHLADHAYLQSNPLGGLVGDSWSARGSSPSRALELAGARVWGLSVEQILSRLGDRFRLLTAGGRTLPSRQQTLRATLDWSCDLLTEPERVLFRRLAVFAGGFTLEAAC